MLLMETNIEKILILEETTEIREMQKHLLVTVLLLAVNAVNVFTSHRYIALSKPALAT